MLQHPLAITRASSVPGVPSSVARRAPQESHVFPRGVGLEMVDLRIWQFL